MTMEELLEKSAAELNEISHSQLEEYFKKYLPITRPDLAIKLEKAETKLTQTSRQGMFFSDNKKLEKLKQKRLAEEIIFKTTGKRVKL